MEAIKQTFFQECEEQLAELETGLLTMDSGDHGSDVVNAVFRAVHSIKGGAGAFGLDDLVRFAHVFETALDAVRSLRLIPDPLILRIFLRAADLLADLVRAAQGRATIDPDRSPALEVELAALTTHPTDAESGWDALLAFQPISVAATNPSGWSVKFKPHASLYGNGNDATVLLRELGRLGPIETVIDLSQLPPLEEIDPESSYLAWQITIKADRPESDVREVFEFVDADCDLEISEVSLGEDLSASSSDEPFV